MLATWSRVSAKNSFIRTAICSNLVQKRNLNLQEYQSKEIMAQNGLHVQRFCVVSDHKTLQDKSFISSFPCDEYVIKAQVLAGGRGKGHFINSGLKGGVRLTKDKDEAVKLASSMLNDRLVTKQTPPDGILVEKVMIAEALDIESEYYAAILLDRGYNGLVLVLSANGGVEIESTDPSSIYRFPLEPFEDSLSLAEVKDMVKMSKLTSDDQLIGKIAKQIIRMHSLFLKTDATMIEVNPLGVTPDHRVVCFDAKLDFDENAEFRQNWLRKYKADDNDAIETAKRKYGLNFLSIPGGDIGCLVNGAGLAMATMDMISLSGGKPANFLDCGGGVTAEGVAAAFGLIQADPSVKSILVNIFGGIVNCETIASGLITAFNDHVPPLIVRLEGTNRESGIKMLKESLGSRVTIATDIGEAARMAVAAAEKK